MLTHRRINVFQRLRGFVVDFISDRSAVVAPMFALTLLPVMVATGAAIDYSRANTIRTSMQAALDAGLLAGARDGSSNWSQVAGQVFTGNIEKRITTGISFTRSFSRGQDGLLYQGTASAAVPTAFMGVIHIPSLSVSVRSTAKASDPDNSCILTLDQGQPTSHVSLSLNGAPLINLSGCSIRSNTALSCNGHDGNLTKSIASGAADGCGTPTSYAPPVPDIYAALAGNIVPQCGTSRAGITWTAGIVPLGAGIRTVTINGRTESHICGDLTLSGTGFLTSSSPSADTLIVIENGSLNIADGAAISAARMAVVLTGDNTIPSQVNFPTGNGKLAKLTLSPPLDANNPWQGVALYQDPKLTRNVDNRWGPGADFNADGLVYLGNSNVVTDGNTASSNAKCSKFVMNSFTTNGRVSLDFDQSVASCAAIGLKQWGGVVVHLTN